MQTKPVLLTPRAYTVTEIWRSVVLTIGIVLFLISIAGIISTAVYLAYLPNPPGPKLDSRLETMVPNLPYLNLSFELTTYCLYFILGLLMVGLAASPSAIMRAAAGGCFIFFTLLTIGWEIAVWVWASSWSAFAPAGFILYRYYPGFLWEVLILFVSIQFTVQNTWENNKEKDPLYPEMTFADMFTNLTLALNTVLFLYGIIGIIVGSWYERVIYNYNSGAGYTIYPVQWLTFELTSWCLYFIISLIGFIMVTPRTWTARLPLALFWAALLDITAIFEIAVFQYWVGYTSYINSGFFSNIYSWFNHMMVMMMWIGISAYYCTICTTEKNREMSPVTTTPSGITKPTTTVDTGMRVTDSPRAQTV
jgi:hypothetical protein